MIGVSHATYVVQDKIHVVTYLKIKNKKMRYFICLRRISGKADTCIRLVNRIATTFITFVTDNAITTETQDPCGASTVTTPFCPQNK